MKNILTTLLIILYLSSYGQNLDSLNQERKKHVREGTYRALVGAFCSLISVSTLVNPIKDPDTYIPFSIFGAMSIPFYCSSIPEFSKARKIKKQIKKTNNE